MMATQGPDQQTRTLVFSMILGGLFVIALAIAVGIAVDALYFGIAIFSLIDFGLAWAFATGRVGPRSVRRDAEAAGAARTAAAEADPSYNPYARED